MFATLARNVQLLITCEIHFLRLAFVGSPSTIQEMLACEEVRRKVKLFLKGN